MGARHCAMLAIVIAALSFTLPATAQERGNQTPAFGNPSGGRTKPRTVGDIRKNFELAARMTGIPEFVQALRMGDAKAAKRIFVAHGGSDDQIILVPVVGWRPTTGYNVSEPMLAPVNPVPCQVWIPVPWGPPGNIKFVCAGIDKNGDWNWVN